ncbi:MAG: hypothetical protein R3253_16225, partial [Longimicrobiales bacterium]|nr:hypothetical protein [Longimicrobiales bacterium]
LSTCPSLLITAWAATAPAAAAQDETPALDLSASANVVGQATGESSIRSEVVGSLDLFADVRLSSLRLHVYVEANSSPRDNGVSSAIPFANMDAGTALGADGHGRVQLSELRLAWPFRERAELHVGLIDLTGYLDVSRIANDENLFFLGQPFVNNPTILFPDYTLGATLVLGVPQVPQGRIALAVAGSHGLADNPEASYGELLDLDAPDKGVFLAGRFRWEAEGWEGAVGAWTSTARRVTETPVRPLPDLGVYSVLGISSEVHSLNARVGLAHGDGGTEPFLGLTYLGTLSDNAFGLGLAKTPALPSFVDRSAEHLEAFVRRSVWGAVFLTSSVQWLSESLLPEGAVDGGVWIFGFRLSAAL